jgi:putative phosphoribosyl transferase
MDTTQTVRLTADGAPLTGQLLVPRGSSALVVCVSGGCGLGRTERESRIVDLLRRQGIATLQIDLVAVDETPSRSARRNVDLLSDRLSGVLAWLRTDDRTAPLTRGFCGVDSGAAAVLQTLSTSDVDGEAAVFLDGRVDLVTGDLDAVVLPTLFVADIDHEHLADCTREGCSSLGTESSEKNILWATEVADAIFTTTAWFSLYLPSPGAGTETRPGADLARAESHD